jgi:hypothetical protein
MATAALTGVSFLAAQLVPRLLLPGLVYGGTLWGGKRVSRDVGDGIELHDGDERGFVTIHPTLRLISRVEFTKPTQHGIMTHRIEYRNIKRSA